MKGKGFPVCRPADNPFSSGRIERLAFRFASFDVRFLLARLKSMGWRGAIVGPPGSGKTTLLETIAAELGDEAKLISVSEDGAMNGSTFEQAGEDRAAAGIVLLDSAERLGWIGWRRFSRSCRRLIITVHEAGRLPTIVECHTTPELLDSLVGELAPEHIEQLAPILPGLFDRNRGDIRRCFRQLFDLFAGIDAGDPLRHDPTDGDRRQA